MDPRTTISNHSTALAVDIAFTLLNQLFRSNSITHVYKLIIAGIIYIHWASLNAKLQPT